MNHLCFSVLCLLCLCARLFICALWSPAGKGLTSWLSFVVSNCEFVTFPLVYNKRTSTSRQFYLPKRDKIYLFAIANNICTEPFSESPFPADPMCAEFCQYL